MKLHLRRHTDARLRYFLTLDNEILSTQKGRIFFKRIPDLISNLYKLDIKFTLLHYSDARAQHIVNSTKLIEFNAFTEVENMLNTHPELFI